MSKVSNNANPKKFGIPPYFTFIPMRTLVLNYAMSSGTHPCIKCDYTELDDGWNGVQRLSDTKCNIPSSEPFRINIFELP
jgi:hypothetical protein